jgi:hypothetical protein
VSSMEELIRQVASLKRDVETLQARERLMAVRGWRDDFLGDHFIQGPYTAQADGAGAIAILGSAHGGWAELANDAVLWNRCRLWLGDEFDGYATLDIDYGWVQISQFYFSSLVSSGVTFGASDTAENNYIRAGYNSAGGANWEIIMASPAGVAQHVQSDIAADTDPHVHRLEAYASGGVHYVDYYVDGVLAASADSGTYNIPAGLLTPLLRVQNRAAVQKIGWWDYWTVAPMNL